MSLWRRPACQTLMKVLDLTSLRASVAPDLLEAPAILSDATVRTSAVDQEDLKPYKPITYKFFRDFTNYIKKTKSAVVFSFRTFHNILKHSEGHYVTK